MENQETELIEELTDQQIEYIGETLHAPEVMEYTGGVSESLFENDEKILQEHNRQYSNMLKVYVENLERNLNSKQEQKQIMYETSKSLLIGIPTGIFIITILLLLMVSKQYLSTAEIVIGFLTVAVSFTETLIIIPKMITSYLFDKNEEKTMSNVILNIQKYDMSIRDGRPQENDRN